MKWTRFIPLGELFTVATSYLLPSGVTVSRQYNHDGNSDVVGNLFCPQW